MGDGELASASGRFSRTVDALPEMFDFVEHFFAEARIARDHLLPVQFVLEEMFTNQVKYAAGGTSPILIDLSRRGEVLRVSLTDFDVEPFDLRNAPAARTDAPIEERRPGGLGIHLIKKMVDSIDYEYAERRSKTTITKSLR